MAFPLPRLLVLPIRRLLVLLLALALGSLTTGCGLLNRSTPQKTMDALVAGLSAGDLTGVPVTADGAAEAARLPEILAGLNGLKPAVAASSVEQVESSRSKTTAVLEYTWTLPPEHQPWTYARDVALIKSDGQWLVQWTPDLLVAGLVAGEKLTAKTVVADRADITDPEGDPLITEREVRRVGIDKSQVRAKRVAASAKKLATVLDIDPDAFVQAVTDAGPQAFVEGLAVRASDRAELTRISKATAGVDGVRFVEAGLPLAPTRAFARAVLGTSGPATKEIIDGSGGQVVNGQVVGLSGMQQRYDEQLRGRPGLAVQARDTLDQPREVHEFAPIDGRPLALSLDAKVQQSADDALAKIGPAASLVAVQPSTGRILAAASGPGADGQSVATQAADPPGSTFKIVTALALLRAGLSPDDTVECTPTVTVDGRRFENYDDYPAARLGRITLTEAFANSCNTALIAQHQRVSQADLADAAQALGLNTDPDLGYPFRLGGVPEKAASDTEHAASMIGQGKVATDALGMATVVASVVRGERVTPQLLADGPADPTTPATALTAAEANQLRALMRAVTTQGSGSLLAGLPGEPVLSKTGTAEYGTGSTPQTAAWMVAAQGDLAVAVYVRRGDSGSGTAGPVLKRFLQDLG